MANDELDIWVLPKSSNAPSMTARALVVWKSAHRWTIFSGSSARVSPTTNFSPGDGINSLGNRRKQGYVALLENAPVRSGAALGSVLPNAETTKCIALMLDGRTLSEHAILNYLTPLLKGLSRASDAVSLLNQLEHGGANPANIRHLRKAIQDVGWEEIDGPSSAYLNPPQPCLGPWSW